MTTMDKKEHITNVDILCGKTLAYWLVSKSYNGRSAEPISTGDSIKLLGAIAKFCGPQRKLSNPVAELLNNIIIGGKRVQRVG